MREIVALAVVRPAKIPLETSVCRWNGLWIDAARTLGPGFHLFPKIPMRQKPGGPLRFWLVVAAAVLGLALLLQSTALKTALDGMIHWTEGIMNAHPIWGAVVFFVFSALSAMLAFASSVVLVPSANLAWGKTVTFLLLWGGWTAGAAAAFAIGRSAGPLLARLAYREKLEKYQKYVTTRMRFWMVFVFCLAVPSEIPGYLFGGLKYPFFKFLAAISMAEAVYALGVIVAGDKLLTAEFAPLLFTLGAMAMVAVAAGLVLRRLRRRQAPAADSAASGRVGHNKSR